MNEYVEKFSLGFATLFIISLIGFLGYQGFNHGSDSISKVSFSIDLTYIIIGIVALFGVITAVILIYEIGDNVDYLLTKKKKNMEVF